MKVFSLKAGPHQSCGKCKACCTVLGVKEFDKPPRVSCAHLCEIGCSIYESRPQSCQDFECLWLAGHIDGRPRNRPDILGIIFTAVQDGPIAPFVQATEVWKGAADTEKVAYMLNKIAYRDLVVVKRFDGSLTILGPRNRVAMARRIAQANREPEARP